MKLKFLFICLTLSGFSTLNLFAQCDQCPPSTDKPDYCNTQSAFPGKCAQFSANKTEFAFYSSNKSKTPTMLKTTTEPTQEAMLELLKQDPKLDAHDILFLMAAIKGWSEAKMNLGFTVLPSGLAYKLVKEGTGKLPEKNKKVKVHYKGYLPDGKTFDSSYDRNQPIEITLGVGQVIKGWDEGIGLFKVGSKGVLKIPPQLGYGPNGTGPIPGNATLFFDIEVVSAE